MNVAQEDAQDPEAMADVPTDAPRNIVKTQLTL